MKKRCSKAKTATLIVAMLAMTAGVALAGNPWFTGRTVGDQTEPLSWLRHFSESEMREKLDEMESQLSATMGTVQATATVASGKIDLVISLKGEKTPGAEREQVERIIGHFADAVYEMTEGSHRLRNVRIFQKGDQAGQSDIVWDHEGIPCSSGIGQTGGKVSMYDRDPRNSSDYTEEQAGYTLAHEWGHYFYGLYDEYAIKTTDVAVDQSVMNRQFSATGGNYKWLNFSIAYQANDPTGPWVNTRLTAHHREMNASGWETLARNPTDDPATRDHFDLGTRIFYPEVAAKAPTGTNTPVINLPNTAARQVLKILWGNADVVTVLVLDRSGSMDGDSIDNLIQASGHLLDVFPVGSYVGIISFASDVRTDAAIRKINSDADRTTLKNIVNGLYASGSTSLGQASVAALNQIQTFLAGNNAVPSVFLMTDGYGNNGTYQDLLGAVVPLFQNAQVPIMGFGYGGNVDPRLPQMAQQTGGKYYDSPTDYTTIALAFQDAFGYVSGLPSVASGSMSTASGGMTKPVGVSFPVDSTIGAFTVTLTYDGFITDADIQLFAPGSKVGLNPKSKTESSGQSLWLFEVDPATAGQWRLKGTVASGLAVRYTVNATEAGATYNLRTEIQGGSSVTAPSPATIIAHLSRGLPIDGAKVTATVTAPDGRQTTLPMQSQLGGVYTATYNAYTQNGAYAVDVVAENVGRARLTYRGMLMSMPLDGKSYPIPRDILIKEKFSRTGSLQINLSGVTHMPIGVANTWGPTFMWPADADALGYLLEVYRGDKKILSKPLKKDVNTFLSKPLPVGDYEWRVGTWKLVQTGVNNKGKPVFKKVNVWSPAEPGRYDFSRMAIVPGAITKLSPSGDQLTGDVILQWMSDAKAQSYVITLERLDNKGAYKRAKVYRLTPKTPGVDRLAIKKITAGSYRWFIQGVSFDGSGPVDQSPMEFIVR